MNVKEAVTSKMRTCVLLLLSAALVTLVSARPKDGAREENDSDSSDELEDKENRRVAGMAMAAVLGAGSAAATLGGGVLGAGAMGLGAVGTAAHMAAALGQGGVSGIVGTLGGHRSGPAVARRAYYADNPTLLLGRRETTQLGNF